MLDDGTGEFSSIPVLNPIKTDMVEYRSEIDAIVRRLKNGWPER